MTHDLETGFRFLRHVMPPGTCLELRILGAKWGRGSFIVPNETYSSTMAHWYTNPNDLIVDASRMQGVSGYITHNPVKHDLLARSEKINRAKNTTTDADIECLRWLFVDIDAVRPAGISATDEELAHAIAKRDEILAAHPRLAASSIYGRSGNGCWLLVRLPDLPNTDENHALLTDALSSLALRYDDATAKVDVTTKNAARIMGLVGFVKTKGANRPERPHRLATFDSPDLPDGVTFDLATWVAENPPKKRAKTPAQVAAHKVDLVGGGRDVAYAIKALEREVVAVSSAPEGARNATLNRAALAMGEFVGAEAIGYESAVQALTVAARQAGLDDGEIGKTIDSGIKAGISRPRDLSHVGQPTGTQYPAVYAPGDMPPSRPTVGGLPSEGDDDEGPRCPVGGEDNPHRLGKLVLRQLYSHPDGNTLRYWIECWYSWKDGSYKEIRGKEIRGVITDILKTEFDRIYTAQLMVTAMKNGDKPIEEWDKKPKPHPVTTRLVGDVMQAITGITLLAEHEVKGQPCWLDDDGGWPVNEVLPMRNVLVHLPSFVAGQPCTRPITPKFFAAHRLAYDWDPKAPEPTEWLKFLRSLWPDDPQSIETLQEWFGLQLVADTSFEKILALIGPTRCGKGTIAEILQALVGPENCANPTFDSMSHQFGLEGLIGKLTAIFPDARLSPKSDQAMIVERLLSISGRDRISIQQKYIAKGWTGRLPTRLMIVSNELPHLVESSGALAGRLVVVRMTESFLGREDYSLKDRLPNELPGILLWAIEGWKRLKERGRFQQPESGDDLLKTMKALSSDHGAFVEECCRIGEDEKVDPNQLYFAWKQWCQANEVRNVGTKIKFGKNLRAAVSTVVHKQIREGNRRPWYYCGIGLIPPEVIAAQSGFDDGEDSEACTLLADDEEVPF